MLWPDILSRLQNKYTDCLLESERKIPPIIFSHNKQKKSNLHFFSTLQISKKYPPTFIWKYVSIWKFRVHTLVLHSKLAWFSLTTWPLPCIHWSQKSFWSCIYIFWCKCLGVVGLSLYWRSVVRAPTEWISQVFRPETSLKIAVGPKLFCQ